MTIETKVMDTIFDIVILTQLVHFEPILNLNKIEFKTNSLSDLPFQPCQPQPSTFPVTTRNRPLVRTSRNSKEVTNSFSGTSQFAPTLDQSAPHRSKDQDQSSTSTNCARSSETFREPQPTRKTSPPNRKPGTLTKRERSRLSSWPRQRTLRLN